MLLLGALASLLLYKTIRTLQILASSPQRIRSRSLKVVIAVVVAIDAALPNIWAGVEVEVDTRVFK